MKDDALLSLQDVHTIYGRKIHALKGVNVAVRAGEIACIIGNNGAGKTTMLKTVSGILRPDRGSIRFDGTPIAGLAPHRIARMGLGHVPEGRRVFARLSVQENLDMGAYSRAGAGLRRDYERVFELFPKLGQRRGQLAGTLSGGEQQMLAMGRALMGAPKLLMLDEPSMGLAPVVVDTIFEIIGRVNRAGVTILLVEQNAKRALRVASRGYVLETGGIVCEDAAEALLKDPKVRKAYLGIQ